MPKQKEKSWKFPCGVVVEIVINTEHDEDFQVAMSNSGMDGDIFFLVEATPAAIKQLERMTAWMRKQLKVNK